MGGDRDKIVSPQTGEYWKVLFDQKTCEWGNLLINFLEMRSVLFILCVFICLFVDTVPMEAGGGCEIQWNWSYR